MVVLSDADCCTVPESRIYCGSRNMDEGLGEGRDLEEYCAVGVIGLLDLYTSKHVLIFCQKEGTRSHKIFWREDKRATIDQY